MRGTSYRRGASALLVTSVLLAVCQSAAGQTGDRTVPRDTYFAAFTPYYSGEYRTAQRTFLDAGRGGVRSSQGRWVDAICYYTMVGECYYHMGQLSSALEQYETALKLYLAHHTWTQRVQFPALQPAAISGRDAPSWGRSSRATRPALFPDRMMSFQGTDVERAVNQGGVVSTPRFHPVVAQEIMRCTALAIRRRTELLGPYARYDSMNRQLVAAISSQNPGNWSRVLNHVQLGMAQLATGRRDEATQTLQNSLVLPGDMDHPLTGMALLELGKLAMVEDRFDQASRLLNDATFAAAVYGQADVVEEAFRYLTAVETLQGRNITPVLERATLWAKAQRFDRLQAALLLSAAESQIATNQIRPAAAMLDQAKRTMRRRDMLVGDLGGRALYWSASLESDRPNAQQTAAAATKYYRNGSHWLFHIALVDRLYTSGSLDTRESMSLFSRVLREPSSKDWIFNPEESLTYVTSDRTTVLQHWFDVALKRKDRALAIEISDELRRQRYLGTQPLGGRLVGLRWVMEAPESLLKKSALLRRQEILNKYPYADLSRRAAQLRDQLAAIPLQPEEREQRDQQRALAAELEKTSAAQEAMLRMIAFRREACPMLFPPRLSAKKLQNELQDDQAILTFAVGARSTTAFLVTRDAVKHWQLNTNTIRRHLVDMLRSMGNFDRNQSLTVAQLTDESWQSSAEQLRVRLLGDLPESFWNRTREIVIVPDDFLWYLPFDALPVADGETTVPLLTLVQLRYLPLVSLLGARKIHAGTGPTTLVAGQLYPRDDAEANADLIQLQQEAIPDTTAVQTAPTAASSSLAGGWKRLIVLDDIDDSDRDSFAWSPLQVDRGREGSQLYDWMRLPWGVPNQVILPGFHSAAENAMKRSRNGDDLFLPVCGLMAEGAQTVLISRWRTGGPTAMQLIREFTQELPHEAAAGAWQRSVQLLSETEIEWQREPRLKAAGNVDVSQTADHPFFWSGYLLVDTGAQPNRAE